MRLQWQRGFPETAAGLDESGLGARGAAAPSRGNASGGGPSRGNSSGGGAIGGQRKRRSCPWRLKGSARAPFQRLQRCNGVEKGWKAQE
jgi:hypothetical protein